jgi:hypothetical protein
MGVVHRMMFGLVSDELFPIYEDLRNQSISYRERKTIRKNIEAKKIKNLVQENPTTFQKTVQNNCNLLEPQHQVNNFNSISTENPNPNTTEKTTNKNRQKPKTVKHFGKISEKSSRLEKVIQSVQNEYLKNVQKVTVLQDISNGQKVVVKLDSLLIKPKEEFKSQTIGNQSKDTEVEKNLVSSKISSIPTSTRKQNEDIFEDERSKSLPSQTPNIQAQIVFNDSSVFPSKLKRGIKRSIKPTTHPDKIKKSITEDQNVEASATKQIPKTTETKSAQNSEPVSTSKPLKTYETRLKHNVKYSNVQLDNTLITKSNQDHQIQNANTISKQQTENTFETRLKPLQDGIQNDKSLSVLQLVKPSETESKLPSTESTSVSDEPPSTSNIKSESNDPILCLLCSDRDFPNMYEYQRHLALSHFREQIAKKYFPASSKSSESFSCDLCNSKPGQEVKFFYSTFLAIHLSTVHDCCDEFATSELAEQLNELKSTR